jgi:ribosomal-protein-alanine N-acetyltransferase
MTVLHSVIRPLAAEDVSSAARLEAQVYSQPWTENMFREEISQPYRTYLAAEIEGSVAGYGGVMVVGDEAHITTVVVDPTRRGHRLGTRLMLGLVDAALAAEARSLTLEVRVSNEAAQALYRRFGMAPVGVRKQYYRDEDALIMWVHDIDGEEYRERLADIRRSL